MTVRAIGVIVAALLWAIPVNAAEPFRFVALGDMPYGDDADFKQLIIQINAAAPAFSIHVGDIKTGSSPCTDSVYVRTKAMFQTFEAPLFYTPGDNEWTDCHRKKAGKFAPRKRLAHLRQVFFAEPKSFGKVRMDYQRQSDDFPENAIWRHEGVLFATVHVVGSNNGLDQYKGSDEEHHQRDAANRAWIAEAFANAKAQDAAAVVLTFHGAPKFDWYDLREKEAGLQKTLEALAKHSVDFARPVLLVHGDHHRFIVDRPLHDPYRQKYAGNVMRLQVFGHHTVGAVEVHVDVNSQDVFAFRPILTK